MGLLISKKLHWKAKTVGNLIVTNGNTNCFAQSVIANVLNGGVYAGFSHDGLPVTLKQLSSPIEVYGSYITGFFGHISAWRTEPVIQKDKGYCSSSRTR